MSVTVRPATLTDVPGLAALAARAGEAAFSRERLRKLLQNGGGNFVAVDPAAPAGNFAEYVGLTLAQLLEPNTHPNRPKGPNAPAARYVSGQLLLVRPDVRRHGIGSELSAAREQFAREHGAEIFTVARLNGTPEPDTPEQRRALLECPDWVALHEARGYVMLPDEPLLGAQGAGIYVWYHFRP